MMSKAAFNKIAEGLRDAVAIARGEAKAQEPIFQNPALLDEFLTRPQLALRLGRSVKTIDRWHRVGYGPPRMMLGAFPVYTSASVAAWIERRALDKVRRARSKG